jgi:signal transduction histidine kinase
LILPLTRDNAPIGILVSALSQQNNDLDIEQNQLIVYLAENISVAISAIEKQKELVIANSKLFELSRMALLSARNASIGEITAAIASEFSLPIRVINTNLELLKSGVGDTNIRFEIIKTQLNKISDVIQKLLNLSETYSGNMSVERINVVETIDDVLFFISSQFNRNGIEISKKNVSTEPFIYCSKPIFEQILMNLLLVLKDNMTDNGRIDINVFDEKRATVSILISGDGNGIPQYFDQSGFLPELLDDKDYYKVELSLELISSLIKEIGGKIKITSIPYNGTTVKITFSKREKK